MMTEIVEADKKGLGIAAKILSSDGIVVFPTETVYGIGADVFNADAVKKIFEIKKRPLDNPTIVHISEISQLKKIAENIPDNTLPLMKKFWPGPLTIIFLKKKEIPDIATAGLSTVAVRMPSHPVARKLIEISGCPIAAPSANIAGRPSCTNHEHAIEEFDGKVDAIIKGGATNIGLESTVIKIGNPSYLLRPGKISLADLKKILPDIQLQTASEKPVSPGMKYIHYAPRAKLILLESEKDPEFFNPDVIITIKKTAYKTRTIRLKNKKELAKNLFSLFRELDKQGVSTILVEGVDEKGIGLAIMNRLRKAAIEIL